MLILALKSTKFFMNVSFNSFFLPINQSTLIVASMKDYVNRTPSKTLYLLLLDCQGIKLNLHGTVWTIQKNEM